jgi:hypothetical protein
MMIYICCRRRFFYIFEDYAKSIESQVPVKYISFDLVKKLKFGLNDIIVFLRTIPKGLDALLQTTRHYLLNTEQLARADMKLDIIQCLKPNTKILDYSLANIECMKNHNNFGKIEMAYLPYQINPKEIYNYPKIHNVCMIGYSSPRRSLIMNEIKLLPNSNVITGFGRTRDDLVFRHKILVNIHFDENYKIFEQIRCNRCVFNKMIVITEHSYDDDMAQKHELSDFIISVPYSEVMNKVRDVLANYDFYYHKLFDNFDINALKSKYQPLNEILN